MDDIPNKIFVTVLAIGLIVILSCLFILQANATEAIPRWYADTGRYTWNRFDELSFVKVRPECEKIRTGRCGKLLTEDFGYVMVDGLDTWTGRKWNVIRNSNGCYFELFQYDYGADGNSHYDELYWVDCESVEKVWDYQYLN